MSESDRIRRPRVWVPVVLLLVILPVLRVVSTYRVFSETADEPSHVAAGFQWLSSDVYDLDPEHPPLARIGFALEPFLSGASMSTALNRVGQGNEILYRNDRYRHNLANVRAANLPFLLLALVVVGLWSKRLFDGTTAVLAMALFGSLPSILGHAGLATTDMAATATTVAAAFAFSLWLDNGTWRETLMLAIAVGLGLIAKFSVPVFLFAATIPMLLLRYRTDDRAAPRFRARAWQSAAGLAIVVLIVSAAYKFSTGKLNDARFKVFPDGSREFVAAKYARVPGYAWVRPDLLAHFYDYVHVAEKSGVSNVDFVDWARAAGYPSPLAGRHGNTMAGAPPLPRPAITDLVLEPVRAGWQWIGMNVPVPAPLFVVGLEYVGRHSTTGHPAFLLGRYSDRGWWYYFPVVLFFKTPLPFFFLALVGISWMLRRDRRTAAIGLAPLAMLLPAMASSINIGVRHILPIYPFLAIAAAAAVVALWRARTARAWSRAFVLLLLAWNVAATTAAHPDYFAYFNECAGRHPEQIADDSNLDWGQDVLRLADIVHAQHISHLYVSYFGSADWKRHLPEGEELPRAVPVHGWVAISEMALKFGGPNYRGDGFEWLQSHTPVRHAGKSIRLYYVH
jgi:4-amino-4-deoxy-L-arabinose transferase-like glycosyltransferase